VLSGGLDASTFFTWWEDIVMNNFGPHDWMSKDMFFGPHDWMSKDMFFYLCDELKPLLEKQTTRLRVPVSIECRIAITLWILATAAEYRTVAHLFGVARCTVCLMFHETCNAIVSKLLLFPTGDELKKVVKGFKEKWDFPQCTGWIPYFSHTSLHEPHRLL